MDDASSAASNSDVIYTPPMTPRSSHSHSFSRNDSGNDNLLSPNYPLQQQQNTVTVASDHLSSTSAEIYFESRPVPPSFRAVEQSIHAIVVRPNSSPDDFPYQQGWASRDIRQEDWQTFLNYLLPNHAAESNEAVIERKLRAEGIDVDNNDDVKSARSARSEKSARDAAAGERTPVEAQLDQIRSPDVQAAVNMEETVTEWNEGFFGPRGMGIVLEQAPSAEDAPPRMPGAWEQSFNNSSSSPDFANANASPMPDRRPNHGGGMWWRGNAPDRRPNDGSRWWPFNPMNGSDTSSRGINFGGLSIDDDRVAIGNSIVADSNGLRIGGMVMDNNGVRINGRDLFGGGGGSSSSSSESDSDALSIGSLPESEDLRDSQLTVAKTYLEQWLSSPENMITKENIKEAREKLKAAKKNKSSGGSPGDKEQHHDNDGAPAAAAIRQQIRALMVQWKALKREQRTARREARRQKVAHRRAEKRERRQVKREVKRAHRQARRDVKNAAREVRRAEKRSGVYRGRGGGGGGGRGRGRHDDDDHHGSPERRLHQHHHVQGGQGVDGGHHGGTGPFPFGGHRGGGGFGPFGPRGGAGACSFRGRDCFPGAGHGPGAREIHRGGGGGPGGPCGQFPFFGGRGGGGVFPAPGGPGGPHNEFQRSMEDWSRQMTEWGRKFSASSQRGGIGGQPRFPGAWPADGGAEDNNDHDVKDRHVGEEFGGGEQEAGIIAMRDHENENEGGNGGAHAASAVMYASLEKKKRALQGRRDALADFQGDTHGEDDNGEKKGASTLVGMLAEIEELERAVDRLTLEADEQYAKELAALED
ncbi:hypothetical protein VMCG_09517 [Cytospora schulzeri]|uniref:Uncharacterized protein n=1 Tax=Cytospora schulzeri TaxID=448051 RepID=A0A423VFY7_9PEZI|nr:hypothetical protein VMCG_09517 [Valsa malicola]